MGFSLPSSRHQHAASSRRGSQPRRLSVLGVSHALDGFVRLVPRGSISPRSHVQGSLVQGFPLRRSRATSSVAVALSSFTTTALAATAGPQGVPPRRNSQRLADG